MPATTTPHLDDLRARVRDARLQADRLLTSVEGRQASASEEAQISAALTSVRHTVMDLERAEDAANARTTWDFFASGPGPAGGRPDPRGTPGHSLGRQFLASETFRYLAETKANRPGVWHAPSSELIPPSMTATTLTGDPASGGALLVPTYIPGIVPSPTAPVVVADLFAQGFAASAAVVWMKESSYTNAAAVTPEGTAKPESAMTFAQEVDPLRKIAHWIPVSNEMLEDAPAISSYLDARLSLGVAIVLDYQLLHGTGAAGVPPQLNGILPRGDLAPAVAVGTGGALDGIAQQISAIENAQQLSVDGIVMNSHDWVALATQKTTTGEYLSGSPFVSAGPNTLWNRAVVLTPQMPVGQALIGCFKTGGQLFRHGPIRVDASNSHQDYFTKNLVAIRAEIRAQLALYRPAAFGLVTGIVGGAGRTSDGREARKG